MNKMNKMNKMVKKGFTLVELLFVMAIIAILAGFAIANLKDSTKVATENSMKNDAKNFIALQHTYFAENQTYLEHSQIAEEPNSNGIVTTPEGVNITISKGNRITYTSSQPCADGSLGFFVAIDSSSIDKSVRYDSCTDGAIYLSNNSFC